MEFDTRIDAHCVKHGDNYVLVLSPLALRAVQDLTGQVVGAGEGTGREITDIIWEAIEEVKPWDFVRVTTREKTLFTGRGLNEIMEELRNK